MQSLALLYLLIAALLAWGPATAGEPGLPFTEDFADTDLRDASATNANWSTDAQALLLARSHRHFGAFEPAVAGIDISADAHYTLAVAYGDVDGDGDLDLVAGNYGQANRL